MYTSPPLIMNRHMQEVELKGVKLRILSICKPPRRERFRSFRAESPRAVIIRLRVSEVLELNFLLLKACTQSTNVLTIRSEDTTRNRMVSAKPRP